jgi:hypothetical protein
LQPSSANRRLLTNSIARAASFLTLARQSRPIFFPPTESASSALAAFATSSIHRAHRHFLPHAPIMPTPPPGSHHSIARAPPLPSPLAYHTDASSSPPSARRLSLPPSPPPHQLYGARAATFRRFRRNFILFPKFYCHEFYMNRRRRRLLQDHKDFILRILQAKLSKAHMKLLR